MSGRRTRRSQLRGSSSLNSSGPGVTPLAFVAAARGLGGSHRGEFLPIRPIFRRVLADLSDVARRSVCEGLGCPAAEQRGGVGLDARGVLGARWSPIRPAVTSQGYPSSSGRLRPGKERLR